ncbi:DNA-binding transcriptional regulator, ArsR family [Paenibacillus catalpae]|uniref:DNA-binding transcriptional regulator, ArsR family n=1 Tax=Paenibacillus catalpae TaxID=1045775 RepID=A0A1I1ULR9_9BACL|nr:metalloregulator ArsR/SmtB family transcription factor [Paenibacillus catalpae]SFD71766.1 DNA-binding transcriptional regulator, ArsR family [Paenibacillus catalpae]
MEKMIDDQCDDSCLGTELHSDNLANARVEEKTAFDLAELFKALGDPTRVKMIYALLDRELCVHDLCQVLDMAQSAVSHQLRYLRNVRIVKRRKAGKTVYYSLDDDHVKEIFIQTLQHVQHYS